MKILGTVISKWWRLRKEKPIRAALLLLLAISTGGASPLCWFWNLLFAGQSLLRYWQAFLMLAVPGLLALLWVIWRNPPADS